ncbi:acyltransferase [Peribacillus sp. ACCC06369]|uniref:acyltransferase family protein n=1 Tax=Peribacillus sp. ACCC06369 TaxID=3055860 RepID=UPI0025A0E7E5|nr:acyltransferase [Peribacillus sp. ACCC06369]MDM5359882.1 acyltransferase [Peribacillus sp. ACCC06369]
MNGIRYNQLDSLRGLAAISVVFHHYLLIFPQFFEKTIDSSGYTLVNILKYTPLHIFFSGTQAVTMFFVLSGFVLSLPYLDKRNNPYPIYLTKRMTRIYIPYIVSVIFVLAAFKFFSDVSLTGFSSWANGKWSDPIDYKLIFEHLLLIGDFKNGEYNPIYWSLVHEMRISIIFPLIMIVVIKYGWKFSLMWSLLISGFGFVGTFILGEVNIETDYLLSLYYGLSFVIGAILAKHKDILINFLKFKSKGMKILITISAILLYTFPSWILNIPFIPERLLGPPNTVAVTIGAAMFIILALASNIIKKVLLIKPILFLGDISYSLYLYHCIPLLVLLHQFSGTVQTWILLVIGFIISITLATLSYYFVEKPSIKLGKEISKKFNVIKNNGKRSA